MNEARSRAAIDRTKPVVAPAAPSRSVDLVCPACGAACEQVKCKVVCPRCRTIVLNCSEF